jgi:hypothetical protein
MALVPPIHSLFSKMVTLNPPTAAVSAAASAADPEPTTRTSLAAVGSAGDGVVMLETIASPIVLDLS